MSEQDDWRAWGESWQSQPVVDVALLHRQVRRKRWRMIAMVAFEAVTSVIAIAQMVWLLQQPALSVRWRIFGVGAMVLLPALWAISVWVRRGTWRESGEGVDALLRLTRRRALAGIRLAKLGLWALGVLLVFVVATAWPQLDPSVWLQDVQLRRTLTWQIAVNSPIVVASVAIHLWYIRRQRRRLARIAALQHEQASQD